MLEGGRLLYGGQAYQVQLVCILILPNTACNVPAYFSILHPSSDDWSEESPYPFKLCSAGAAYLPFR